MAGLVTVEGLPPLVPVPTARSSGGKDDDDDDDDDNGAGDEEEEEEEEEDDDGDDDYDSDNSGVQYESEDDGASDGDEDDGGFNDGTGDDALRSTSVTRLDRQIARAQRTFGPMSTFAVPSACGFDKQFVYFSFPVPAHTSGHVWGFDDKAPIQMRMECTPRFDQENLPRGIRDLKLCFYQGSEPDLYARNTPTSLSAQTKDAGQQLAISASSSSSKRTAGGESKSKPHTSAKPTFRLAAQLEHLAEAFLAANWLGENRRESSLTLTRCDTNPKKSAAAAAVPPSPQMLRQASLQQCPACTYLNAPGRLTCEMCDTPLQNISSAGSKQALPPPSSTLRTPSTPAEEMRAGFLHIAAQHDDLLAQLYAYVLARLPQLHRFCVNCDCTHLNFLAESMGGGGGSGGGGGDDGTSARTRTNTVIKPSVCRRELCSWAFSTLGVGRASTDELASTAEVVDLLLAITTAAATSGRASTILSPFPDILSKNKKKILDSSRPDYALAGKIAQQLPSMQQLASAEESSQLVRVCDQAGPHAFALFNWILASNPTYMVSLRGEDRIAAMGTKYQFLMRSSSPEGEHVFNAAKKKHGSVFGYHGSSIENWHSILRNGLKNCSGTKLQVNGAAYGSGVYISPTAAMSLGYSKVGHGEGQAGTSSTGPNAFLLGRNIFVMALCEIVGHGIQKNRNNIWVVPNEKHVVTRFLFVFVSDSSDFGASLAKARQCVSTNAAFVKTVRETISKTWGGEY